MTDLSQHFLSEVSDDLLALSSTSVGEGLTSTLKSVQDGAGTATPLKLSTTEVHAAGFKFVGQQLHSVSPGNLDSCIKLGLGRNTNAYSFVDLIGDATYTDYGTRLIRHIGGPNTVSEISHRGTGPLRLTTIEAGHVELFTAATRRATITDTGWACFGNQVNWSPVDSNVDGMSWRPGYGLAVLAGSGAAIYAGTNHSSRPYMGFQLHKGVGNIVWTGSITTDGTSTFFNTTSDHRLKENIEDLPSQLGSILALRPRHFTWKEAPEKGPQQGFIAHELAEVFPAAVWGAKDALDDDGKPILQAVDSSKLIPALVKAIQDGFGLITDLQNEVAALKTRIEVLEGNA